MHALAMWERKMFDVGLQIVLSVDTYGLPIRALFRI